MSKETLLLIEEMLAPLPEHRQQQVIEHLREYLAEIQSEERWEQLDQDYAPKLEKMAQRAKQQISEGIARPMNLNDL